MANRVLGRNLLGAQHLLDLVPDRAAIFEQQRQMLIHSKTAALPFGDKQRTKSRPQNLVLLERQNFFERDGLHCLVPEREPGLLLYDS